MSNSLEAIANQIREAGLEELNTIKEAINKYSEELKTQTKAVQDAMLQGDFSENADLLAAREAQATASQNLISNQRRLKSLEESLEGYEPSDIIRLGTTVELSVISVNHEPPNAEQLRLLHEHSRFSTSVGTYVFRLVLPEAGNASQNFVPTHSPVGHAVIDHIAGETITINAPTGAIEYKIERIY